MDTEGPHGSPITIYLAEKYHSQLLPEDSVQRMKTLHWFMFQMGGVGPTFGQALHFCRYTDEINIAKMLFLPSINSVEKLSLAAR